MTEQEYLREWRKYKDFPRRIGTVKRKMQSAEQFAKRYNFAELASNIEHANREWDRVIDEARAIFGYGDL